MESAELAAAKALARKLRRDSDVVGYASIEWAVGVFRSEAGGATECVVMSNEGFGYIPWGIFLPRTARNLASDTLVDSAFRGRWFGCSDAGEVMAEYAKLRASAGGSHLVALAVTADSSTGRPHGVEYVLCPREWEEGVHIRPILDDMHMHRLESLHPDLYGRIQRLSATPAQARELVENKLVVELAMQLMDKVDRAAAVQAPAELRQMWDALGTGDGINEKTWRGYKLAAATYYVMVSAARPQGSDVDEGRRAIYRSQWAAARAMELLRGWERRPPGPSVLADMIYAFAAQEDNFASMVEPKLRALENDAAAA
ncbi:hypothetical protein [Mycobacterium persicum]|uniref:hypothetical protein n=1 Tax=Mycobacterium persicum TaxID=1487726 RepID=UPI00115F7014|nr:hypothetical protein [Mycobacterium persicum]